MHEETIQNVQFLNLVWPQGSKNAKQKQRYMLLVGHKNIENQQIMAGSRTEGILPTLILSLTAVVTLQI